jgi:hypothetical protein
MSTSDHVPFLHPTRITIPLEIRMYVILLLLQMPPCSCNQAPTTPARGTCSALRSAPTGFASDRPACRRCRSHRKIKKVCIRRADHALLPATPDFNYGLFFIPTGPTDDETAQTTRKPFNDKDGPFEFGVVMRGRIEISRLLVDCNMQNQGLEAMPKDAAEHSAMLGFSGFRYKAEKPSPAGLRRFV